MRNKVGKSRPFWGYICEFNITIITALALLSVAANDRNGRPDAEVLQALEGIQLLRTSRNRWIEISTDGEEMWVAVERK